MACPATRSARATVGGRGGTRALWGKRPPPTWSPRATPCDSTEQKVTASFLVSPRQAETLGDHVATPAWVAVVQRPVTGSPVFPLPCPAWVGNVLWPSVPGDASGLLGSSQPRDPHLPPFTPLPAPGGTRKPRVPAGVRLTALWGEVVGCIVWGSALLWITIQSTVFPEVAVISTVDTAPSPDLGGVGVVGVMAAEQ